MRPWWTAVALASGILWTAGATAYRPLARRLRARAEERQMSLDMRRTFHHARVWNPATGALDELAVRTASRRDRRACGRQLRHCWHALGLSRSHCCLCGDERRGAPRQRCACCADQRAGELIRLRAALVTLRDAVVAFRDDHSGRVDAAIALSRAVAQAARALDEVTPQGAP